MNNLAKSTRSGVIWGVLQKFINRAVSLLVFIVLARLLEPEDFGLVAIARIVIDYCEMLTGQGLGLAVIQRKELSKSYLNTAFTCTLGASFVITAAIAVTAQPLANLLDEPEAVNIILALSAAVVLSGLTRTQMALLTRDLQFKKLAKLQVFVSMSGAAVGVGLAFNGAGVWSLVGMQLTSNALTTALAWKASGWLPRLQFDRSCAVELYQYGWKVLVEHHIRFLSRKVDEIAIVTFLGSQALGYYSIAKKLAELFSSIFMHVISTVFLSTLSRLQDDLARLKSFVLRSMRLGSMIFTPIYVGGTLAIFDLVPLIFGEQWQASAAPARFFMAAGVFMLGTNLIISAYRSVGHPQVPMYFTIVEVGVKTPLLLALTQYGITGASLAAALTTAVVGLTIGLPLKRYAALTYSECYGSLALSILYCVPMAATYLVLERFVSDLPIVVKLAVLVTASATTYIATLKLSGQDLDELIRVVKNPKRRAASD